MNTWYTECKPTIAFNGANINERVARLLADMAVLFRPFGFIAPKPLNYLAFQSIDFERT
jgi:hypothetical protein